MQLIQHGIIGLNFMEMGLKFMGMRLKFMGMGLKFMGMGLKFMGTGLTHGMLVQGDGAAKVLEAVFADVYLLQLGVLRRVGRGEPSVHLIAAKLHHLQTVLLAVGGVALGRISHMTLFTGWHGNKAINRTTVY